MFAGDIPRRDEPLPRSIDDAATARLLRAAREHLDPFTRLAVEFLARTGLRKVAFLDLTVDSVVQIGSAYWLHVPLGKLRTDRYIPCTHSSRRCSMSGSHSGRLVCASRGCSSSAAGGSADSASGTRSRTPPTPLGSCV